MRRQGAGKEAIWRRRSDGLDGRVRTPPTKKARHSAPSQYQSCSASPFAYEVEKVSFAALRVWRGNYPDGEKSGLRKCACMHLADRNENQG